MSSQIPTPETAESLFDRAYKCDDQDALSAFLQLLAMIAPSAEEEKYKHEIAWRVINHGYKKSDDCKKACRKYLGLAA